MLNVQPFNAFGRLLLEYRLRAGLTQEALAERAALGRRSIQGLERGENAPHRETVQRLAEALGLSPPEQVHFKEAVLPSPRPRRMAPEATLSSRASLKGRRERAQQPHLPSPLTSFIGRERELAEITHLLVAPSSSCRLLTLTGAPGTGKTRLATEVAWGLLDHFADGVYFVPLAPIADPKQLAPAIVRAFHVEQLDAQDAVDRLGQALQGKRALLVLDNFEQVAAAAPLVARLLERCPGLKVLVTSRVRLRVRGERELVVPPLGIPRLTGEHIDGEDLASSMKKSGAVRLFVERARDLRPDFAITDDNATAVEGICLKLDGLPLGIELAAVRIKFLSPAAILHHLRSRLQFLTVGLPDLPLHHQTLRQTIAWSYDLLSSDEKEMFRRLAVFVGGFTLHSASLLLATRADAGTAVLARDAGTYGPVNDEPSETSRNASVALTRGGCEDGKMWLWGTAEASTPSPILQPVWSPWINDGEDAASDSVRQGVESLVDQSLIVREERQGEVRFHMLETIREYALEQLAASGELEMLHRQHAASFQALAEEAAMGFRGSREAERIDWLEREHDNLQSALRFLIDGRDVDQALRLGGLLQWLWTTRGYIDEGQMWLDELLTLTEGPERAMSRARILRIAGRTAFLRSDHALVRNRLLESLAISRELNDREGLAASLAILGLVARAQGDYAQARLLFEESLGISRDLGNQSAIGAELDRIGMLDFYQGDYVAARRLLEESLAIRRTLGDRFFLGWALHELGRIRHGLDDMDGARSLYDECLAVWQEQGYPAGIAEVLASLADLALDQSDPEAADPHLAESLRLFRDLGAPGEVAHVLELIAGRAALLHDPDRALRVAGAAASKRAAVGEPTPPDYKARLERRLTPARIDLGEQRSSAAWSVGSAMTSEQAISYALNGVRSG